MAGKVIDLTGARYGRLLVISQAGYINQGAAWLCRCDCGTEKIVRSSMMRSRRVVSCGCKSREMRTNKGRPVALRHGHARKGSRYSGTYGSWMSMKNRCDNPRSQDYARYGGRGITICNRWQAFEAFLADMGEKPKGCSIERIDPNDNYAPGNCRWATPFEQAQTKRLSAPRVHAVLAHFEAEAPDLIARLRRELLG